MKTISLSVIFLLMANSSFSQSFEEIHFPDITTTISSSRSANFLDVNNDGLDDIFFTNGLSTGEKNMLYINNGDGTFTTVTDNDIVEHSIRAVGASFADVDNDGDNDAYVVTWGANGQSKRNYFYRNNGNGSFTFEENVAPNLTYSETSAWIDANNDGYLDLYVTNSAAALRNLYFENQKDGTFLQKTNLAITNEQKPSRSADWVDYDNDGDNDLFVTNEGNNRNTLYRNDGNGQFTQIADNAIVLDIRDSMGSSWADVNNDGDFDLLVTNSNQANQLFINDGNGNFTEKKDSAIAAEITNSFGSVFADFDNDGDLDLFIANSYSDNHFLNSVFINDGKGNFTKDTESELANNVGWTYSAAFGDYNNDGWLDVILANNQNEAQTNSVFKNTGSGKNWTKVRLSGTNSNKSAIGAILKLTTMIDGKTITQTRKIESASGYCSQNSLTAHFGLDSAIQIQKLEIKWPSGLTEVFDNVSVNSVNHLTEGTGTMNVSDSKTHSIRIYPNPVKEILFIDLKDNVLNENNKLDISDSSGKLIRTENLKSKTENKISLKHIPKGVYFYQISNDKQNIKSGKIIKD
ncbi:FG-GAP-like repeat-containing protein [Epilithonimonas mollis]|uniref:Por secretion system C-terminal sorting domain-containing protein n=1 Tax=Epilithonimonas mollis TaxID=216903 RepID=A0A1M6TV88_9FLAO|nr:FG-GAP-like repeat-containing protein [Epilithonimonas mollis]SHK60813.1 Por secretion system C-terminal sorting domain-containing protein [Epilithonimonas mollis]